MGTGISTFDATYTGNVYEVEIAAFYADKITSVANNDRFTLVVTGSVPPFFPDTADNPCGQEIAISGLE